MTLTAAFDGVEASVLGTRLAMVSDWWRGPSRLGCGMSSLVSGFREDVLAPPDVEWDVWKP